MRVYLVLNEWQQEICLPVLSADALDLLGRSIKYPDNPDLACIDVSFSLKVGDHALINLYSWAKKCEIVFMSLELIWVLTRWKILLQDWLFCKIDCLVFLL